MTSKAKKEIKMAQIRMGQVNKAQRASLWAYILGRDLGCGYLTAQDLARAGFRDILKPREYRVDQPD